MRALTRSPEPAAGLLVSALDGSGSLSEEEAAIVRRIEDKRSELEASQTRLRTPAWEWSGDRSDERILDETVGEVCADSSKPPRWALLLFRLVRSFQPDVSIELGTCVGISAAYQAAALALNGHGSLATFEASKARSAVAQHLIDQLSLSRVSFHQGRFQDTLQPWLDQLSAPIDYAFIDGHHDEQATICYFEQILPETRSGTLLAFDDIYWSDGMQHAWREISMHPGVGLTLDLLEIGICIVGAKPRSKPIALTLRP